MDLSADVVKQIQVEVSSSMAAAGYVEPLDVSAESIGKNKDLILGFLRTLVALIPGVFGKLAGQAIIVAAEAWFKNKGY